MHERNSAWRCAEKCYLHWLIRMTASTRRAGNYEWFWLGHGVGLSQWDAYKLAKEGKSPEQIVMVFFQNARVRRRD